MVAATSSYITVPPPYTHVYSAGGPTGEVHRLDQAIGGLEEKIQQILFVPEGELETADKTRKALVCPIIIRQSGHIILLSDLTEIWFPWHRVYTIS